MGRSPFRHSAICNLQSAMSCRRTLPSLHPIQLKQGSNKVDFFCPELPVPKIQGSMLGLAPASEPIRCHPGLTGAIMKCKFFSLPLFACFASFAGLFLRTLAFNLQPFLSVTSG